MHKFQENGTTYTNSPIVGVASSLEGNRRVKFIVYEVVVLCERVWKTKI